MIPWATKLILILIILRPRVDDANASSPMLEAVAYGSAGERTPFPFSPHRTKLNTTTSSLVVDQPAAYSRIDSVQTQATGYWF